MDNATALFTLSALANGIHPTTGQMFETDSPYQTADVVRALYLAVRAIELLEKKSRRSRMPPANAGKAWTADEDRQLLEFFDQGADLPAIARYHERTVAGVQARLERHGRLSGSDSRLRISAQPQRLPDVPSASERT